MIDVAKTGPEPIRVAAVRELGRLGGPAVVDDLLQVYRDRERAREVSGRDVARRSAMPRRRCCKIAQSETGSIGARRRDRARWGRRVGGSSSRCCTRRLPRMPKRPIIVGLFNAQADDELIQIAEREKDPGCVRESARAAAPARHAQGQGIPRRSIGNPKILTNPEVPAARQVTRKSRGAPDFGPLDNWPPVRNHASGYMSHTV